VAVKGQAATAACERTVPWRSSRADLSVLLIRILLSSCHWTHSLDRSSLQRGGEIPISGMTKTCPVFFMSSSR